MVEMKVEGLVFDPVTNTPIIILKDSGGAKSLPIWVGYPEATAIALEMESVATPRPMTHDLIKNLLGSLKAKVNHITVCDLKNNTFYAIINITINGNTLEVDSRPSDAIAVALRVKAPIYVSNSVLENAKTMENAATAPEPEDEEAFKKWLHNAKPSDFGSIDQ
ncbi:MAG: bifunctional nuclease family protein [Nitrospinae bacterium]|nr:bifunctional nuclease family protein [Nitrospinota bacterium]